MPADVPMAPEVLPPLVRLCAFRARTFLALGRAPRLRRGEQGPGCERCAALRRLLSFSTIAAGRDPARRALTAAPARAAARLG